MMKIAVIGGGAAGFFAAIHAAQKGAEVSLYEKSSRLLSKVRISGGGRCNVTHACFNVPEMARRYPRGERAMKQLLPRFMTTDTVAWFERRGVPLKAEADGRMFPITDSSETIINCLERAAAEAGVRIFTQTDVQRIEPQPNGGFVLATKGGLLQADKVIVATGGSPKAEGLQWLAQLGHGIVPPVPSLFTFNIPGNPLTALMGVAVKQARVKVAGTKLAEEGPLLITHWGISGPAVLKLSAWGARLIHDLGYQFTTQVSWLPQFNEAQVRAMLEDTKQQHGQRLLANRNPFDLPHRLWEFLLAKVQAKPEKRWCDTAKTDLNRLANILTNDQYAVNGKTTYKEEFVTCGGVDLADVDLATMQSKPCPGLYLAGEVLDIDGITGGFNFQAAWATGYVAGTSASTSAAGG